MWAAGLVVAAGAGVATAHGLYQVAAAARVPAPIAWLYPLITDGLALVAYAATARLHDGGRRYAAGIVVLAAGLSGLAQAVYLAGGLGRTGDGAGRAAVRRRRLAGDRRRAHRPPAPPHRHRPGTRAPSSVDNADRPASDPPSTPPSNPVVQSGCTTRVQSDCPTASNPSPSNRAVQRSVADGVDRRRCDRPRRTMRPGGSARERAQAAAQPPPRPATAPCRRSPNSMQLAARRRGTAGTVLKDLREDAQPCTSSTPTARTGPTSDHQHHARPSRPTT